VESTEIRVGDWLFEAFVDGPLDGELVLLLHGFPESAAEWHGVMPQLAAAGYYAVAPNQRGYSAGARPVGVASYHIDHLVNDALGIADTLGAREFHLVGHDWGALVAWALAGAHPDRLRTLTIVSVPHPRPFAAARASDPDQRARSEYIATFRELDAPEHRFLDNDAAILRLAVSEAGPEIAAEHVRVLTDPGAMTAALNYYRAWGVDLDSVGPISVPTLFLWSTNDVALGRVAAEATAEWITGPYQFEVLEGISHWIPEVEPDTVSRLALEHFAVWPVGTR
jgi:pimeloyl-ACP methyl ester carboxylesterase